MKRATLVFILMLIYKGVIFGQTANVDTIGFYHNGKIEYNWKALKRDKTFDEKTFFLQEKYANGNICKEYFRNNDSTFLYTEYYENPDTTVEYKSPSWGKKREGYVMVSNQTTGDTIVVISPATYEESRYMDTLLLPIKQWTSYYLNGNKKTEGEFLDGKRHGLWKFYDEFQNLNQKIKYKIGGIETIELINRIEEKSFEITEKEINGMWIIHDPAANGGYTPNPKFNDYRFMYKIEKINGIGDIYNFVESGELEYTKTKIVKTEYKDTEKGLLINRLFDKVEESKGSWVLINYHQLEMTLVGKKELFEVEYISENKLRLRQIKTTPGK